MLVLSQMNLSKKLRLILNQSKFKPNNRINNDGINDCDDRNCNTKRGGVEAGMRNVIITG